MPVFIKIWQQKRMNIECAVIQPGRFSIKLLVLYLLTEFGE